MNGKPKIVHITSVHRREDIRIFQKECHTLAKRNFEVFLLVADGKGDEVRSGIRILDVGKPSGRGARFLRTNRELTRKALSIDAVIYHFHDPELILLGLRLKKLGKKVIFDAHEDLPKQILTKTYLPNLIRKFLPPVISFLEKWAVKRFDAVICATPAIQNKFTAIQPESVTVCNFPHPNKLPLQKTIMQDEKIVCYIGGLSIQRGVLTVIKAAKLSETPLSLHFAGRFLDSKEEQIVKARKEWQNVTFHGFLTTHEVNELLSKSKIGLVTLHPTPSYRESFPIKLFEYMNAGIPVIASNFPLWRDIVERHRCGLCVDPLDSKAIAEAIDRLLQHPDEAAEMGYNGRQAVTKYYNWPNEAQKLITLYEKLIK